MTGSVVGDKIPARVEIAESVLYQALEGEIVLLNMENQGYFGLDDVGARMWELLLEHHDLQKVVQSLQNEFDADADSLRTDLDRLVGELLAAGLLKPAN